MIFGFDLEEVNLDLIKVEKKSLGLGLGFLIQVIDREQRRDDRKLPVSIFFFTVHFGFV